MLCMFLPTAASAHGGGTPQIVDGAAGPYRISVWTQPEPLRAGEVHLTIAVMEPQSADENAPDQMILDAAVAVDFQPVDPSAAQPLHAEAELQSTFGSPYYEADVELPSEGEWRITVAATGDAGQGAVSFDGTVLPPYSVNWILLASIGLVFGAIIIFMGMRERAKTTKSDVDGALPARSAS